ncbi:hypothetical protein TNCV_2719741 [Trichonephila clavipes]|nr:hypothetical protein TNCV_2719741 [Trichonephila clavipes]
MKKEQDSRQIRPTTVLREQLKLQNNIKCDSSHNKFGRMHPEQMKHLSKGNHISVKIRSATELPEQLKHLFSMRALKWKGETPGMCCSSGKVKLSPILKPPEPLCSLLKGHKLHNQRTL